jgi:predicted transcriptional regulator
LILPCEIAVKTVIPAIRATLAKELVRNYGLTQSETAEILGISQSAVSKYTRKVRGYVVRLDNTRDIQPLISRMITLLVEENPERREFLRLFCKTCVTIRKKGLMCQFCEMTEPDIKEGECDFCINYALG